MKFVNSDLIVTYTAKIDRAYASKLKNSNYKKEAQRYEFLLQFAKTLPLDFVIDCEIASSKNPDEPNAGSFTEIVTTYHYKHNPEIMEAAKSGGTADITMLNGRGIEIKLSLNGSCYNTPVHTPMRVYLINRDGVYIIEKKDIDEVIEAYGKSGHLPFTKWEGARLHKTLSRALGYNVD
jgi:hypothetical protein